MLRTDKASGSKIKHYWVFSTSNQFCLRFGNWGGRKSYIQMMEQEADEATELGRIRVIVQDSKTLA